MRKMFLVIMIAGTIIACNNDKKVDAASETKEKPAVAFAYTPTYSTSFEPGNQQYAAMIVQGSWKDWEMNTMDNMKSWVADTIVAMHADNTTAVGVDSLQARWKRGRSGYTSVIDSIHSATALYSTDKKENWVLVWAKEINTDLKGKIDTVELQETWRINKDGKADRLYQYDRHTRKQ